MTQNFTHTLCGNIITCISDHLPQFLITLEENHKTTNTNYSDNYYKNWKQFDEVGFSNDFNNINWDRALFLNVNNVDVNRSFDNFFNILNELIIKHVPLKKLTRKQTFSKKSRGSPRELKLLLSKETYFLKNS